MNAHPLPPHAPTPPRSRKAHRQDDRISSCRRALRHLFPFLLTVAAAVSAQPYDLVIANGRVMDPETGLDAVRHVAIGGGRISAISEAPLDGVQVVDATGLIVAPGFIDMNIANPDRATHGLRLRDGVTTALWMESAPIDIEDWYQSQRAHAVLNYGTAVGHWQARLAVLGDPTLEGEAKWRKMEHQKADDDEIARIVKVLEQGLAKGALGIGVALEYIPAATQAEMLEVFRLAARHGAPVHLHMRGWGYDDKRILSYGDLFEVFGLAIATDADVHVLHFNASYTDWTPTGLELLARAEARGLPVTAEAYPYAFGGCAVGAAFFDDWETYDDEYFSTKLQLATTGEWLTKEKFRALRESNEEVYVLCYESTEDIVRLALQSPLTMIASDGGGSLHPRTAGTFSRVLGRYVREQKVLPLMDALRKMTLLPARHLEKRIPAMQRKGRVQVGADADLVVFDPHTIIDRSTVVDPLEPSLGMRYVVVNGKLVLNDGVLETTLAGLPVRASEELSHEDE